MNDAICPECGNDNLISYPVCPACATRWHFPHRAVCLHCEHKREAEQNDASTVRWSNKTYAEAAIAAGGVPVIRKAA